MTAAFLAIGPGYQRLRRWKQSGGLIREKAIFRWDPEKLEALKQTRPDYLIPIPQSPLRSWKLGGSPSDRIAEHLSRALHVPVARDVLVKAGSDGENLRQAELLAEARLGNQLRFQRIRPILGRLILVDDFTTTGHTLRSAARSLKLGTSFVEIHGFCLGIRPFGLKQ